MEQKMILVFVVIAALSETLAQPHRGGPWGRQSQDGNPPRPFGGNRPGPFGGNRPGPSGGNGPRFFGGPMRGRQGNPMMQLFKTCKGTQTWAELRAKDCSQYTNDIATKINQLYSSPDEFFRNKMQQFRNNSRISEATSAICDPFICFRIAFIQKAISDGLPSFCDGRIDQEIDMDLGNFFSRNNGQLMENMKTGFCAHTDLVINMIQIKKATEQLGLPNNLMFNGLRDKMRGFNMDCANFSVADVDCSTKSQEYIDAVFSADWISWNIAVDAKQNKIMSNRMRGSKDLKCKAMFCHARAMRAKITQNNGEMPTLCPELWARREEIFSNTGFGNTKMMLITCIHAFGNSVNFKINQPSLVCTNSEMVQNLNNIYSTDTSVVDQTITDLKTRWQNLAVSGASNPEGPMTNEKLCRFKAIRDKLEAENYELPGFCQDVHFDHDITTTSVQDVKQLMCLKFEKMSKLFQEQFVPVGTED